MGLRAVTKPGTVPSPAAVAGWEQAVAAAPAEYFESTIEMLPQAPHRGRCRICGRDADLTREHIPPQAVGNKGQYRSFTFDEWLNRPEGGLDLYGGDPGQGGVWGYTLCKPCNDLTGQRYGTEYKAWAARAAQLLGDLPSPIEQDRNPEPFGIEFGLGGAEDGGVAPGDFIRQVLSMMCSLSGGWDLAGRHPQIRDMILERACVALPERMAIHLALCWGPRTRMVGPQLTVDAETGHWAWIMELSFAPLSLLMVLDANHEVTSFGVDISPFTLVPPKERKTFETVGSVVVGFTWSVYPWDFRSSAALGYEPSPPGSGRRRRRRESV